MPKRVLTFRQLLLVDMWILLAVAVLWNRHRLPAWMLPEYSPGESAPIIRMGIVPRTYLVGNRGLFLGDSLISANNPWVGDELTTPGADMSQLQRLFLDNIGDRQYQWIVVWGGTMDLVQGGAPESYVTDAVRLVRMLQEHTPHVVVLGPMPFLPDVWRATQPRWSAPARGREVPIDVAHHAAADLQERLPTVPVIDMSTYYGAAIDKRELGALLQDGMHLTGEGFDRLGARLRVRGCDVHRRRDRPRGT